MSSGSRRNSSKPKVPSGLEKTSTHRSASSVWWLASTVHDLSRRDDMATLLSLPIARHSAKDSNSTEESGGFRAVKLIPCFSIGHHALELPTRCLVEALGTRVWVGTQPELRKASREEPRDHDVMQAPAIAVMLVFGIHEERPYVPCLLVADGERHNVSVELDHPATASDFDGGNIVLFRDNGERQPVFPHGKADAMHGRNVTTIGLPQCRGQICHLSTHLHRDKYQPTW